MIEHLAQGARHSRPTCKLPVQHIDVSQSVPRHNSNKTDPAVYRDQSLVLNNPMPHLHVQHVDHQAGRRSKTTHIKNNQFGGLTPPFPVRHVGS